MFGRRNVTTGLLGVATAMAGGDAGGGARGADPPPPAHDMSAAPASWAGSEQIAFLIYPGFTALDMVGPHYMLANLMGATIHVVAASRAPVSSDTGLQFSPTADFSDCPHDLDIICVPGGTTGTLAAMRDAASIAFLRDRGARARYITSVCTGSLLLGAAGLLSGYRATSHWLTRPLLPIFGAIPTDARVVRDRNRITGAGVTAGIDFGLTLVADLRDRTYAEGVQLLAEYAPDPPFQSGTPTTAPEPVRDMLSGMFTRFLAEAEAVCRETTATP